VPIASLGVCESGLVTWKQFCCLTNSPVVTVTFSPSVRSKPPSVLRMGVLGSHWTRVYLSALQICHTGPDPDLLRAATDHDPDVADDFRQQLAAVPTLEVSIAAGSFACRARGCFRCQFPVTPHVRANKRWSAQIHVQRASSCRQRHAKSRVKAAAGPSLAFLAYWCLPCVLQACSARGSSSRRSGTSGCQWIAAFKP
jgi:hypothetical protein